MMTALYIVLCAVSYLICGIYIGGRFGFSFDQGEDEGIAMFLCIPFWPLFLLWRFLVKIWNLGFKRRFDN